MTGAKKDRLRKSNSPANLRDSKNSLGDLKFNNPYDEVTIVRTLQQIKDESVETVEEIYDQK